MCRFWLALDRDQLPHGVAYYWTLRARRDAGLGVDGRVKDGIITIRYTHIALSLSLCLSLSLSFSLSLSLILVAL